jgi:hypothetical protein
MRDHCGTFWGLRVAGLAVVGVVIAAVFALAFGWLVMLLWNWLMPAIFHLGEIDYWQGFGILILAKLIFGSIGGGMRHDKRRHEWRHGPWAESWEGGRTRWRYYGDFWKEEGRKAFDDYVERKRTEGETPSGGQKT